MSVWVSLSDIRKALHSGAGRFSHITLRDIEEDHKNFAKPSGLPDWCFRGPQNQQGASGSWSFSSAIINISNYFSRSYPSDHKEYQREGGIWNPLSQAHDETLSNKAVPNENISDSTKKLGDMGEKHDSAVEIKAEPLSFQQTSSATEISRVRPRHDTGRPPPIPGYIPRRWRPVATRDAQEDLQTVAEAEFQRRNAVLEALINSPASTMPMPQRVSELRFKEVKAPELNATEIGVIHQSPSKPERVFSDTITGTLSNAANAVRKIPTGCVIPQDDWTSPSYEPEV
ncbi:hypothetical protein BJ742DRAFT_899837 [Cladochytrium replicatum]|nr:hypothetical protein BJ742DRAFT_899837 [Cladochytrium replicatum]